MCRIKPDSAGCHTPAGTIHECALNGTGFQLSPQISALQFSVAQSNLLSASDGTIWFTSYSTGIGTPGSVAQVSAADGSLLQNISLHTVNATAPVAPLIQAADGNLYGAATFGGTVASGTAAGVVFRLNP